MTCALRASGIVPSCYQSLVSNLVDFDLGPNEEIAMLEIAGLLVSGVSLFNDLVSRYQDLTAWTEADLPADEEWLELAIAKGIVPGSPSDYLWSAEDKVATRELR